MVPTAPETLVPTDGPATASPTLPAGDGLSNTGFGGFSLMALGLLLSVAGGAAVVLTARRKRGQARH